MRRKLSKSKFIVKTSDFVSAAEFRVNHFWIKKPKSGARRQHVIPCMLVGFQEDIGHPRLMPSKWGKTRRPVILTEQGDYRVVRIENLHPISDIL